MSDFDPSDFKDLEIESTIPKPWEEEVTFNDILYDWMSRAPWLAISAAAHLIAFLVLTLIPWHLLESHDSKEIQAQIEQPPPEVFEDPPEEEPEEVVEEEPIEEPVLKDSEIIEEPTNEDDSDDAEGDPDFSADSPFDSKGLNDVIGIGGGAGGNKGGRFGKGRGRAGGGGGTEQALKDGLEWLHKHQAIDGSWDCDNFMTNNTEDGCECTDSGESPHDVGMTGLALLAFLGDGHTTRQGAYKEDVTRGIKWMRDQQDYDTGLLGEKIGHSYLYNHGIASLALAEAYYFSKSPLLRGPTQKAINFITQARNPYGAWRYDHPPIGQNDTSVTGWMIFALKSAEESGLQIDPEAYTGALSWFDDMTDPSTGRTGYDERGNNSSRVEGLNDHFPPEKGEAMTAVALLCRFFLGQNPSDEKMMDKNAKVMQKKLPEWDPDGYGCDMYYWYYGSYAMYQMGGSYWKDWKKSMEGAIVKNQRTDGHFKGSWDPVGPWGYSGGRVYSTALMTLCLEVYFRYARVLGAR